MVKRKKKHELQGHQYIGALLSDYNLITAHKRVMRIMQCVSICLTAAATAAAAFEGLTRDGVIFFKYNKYHYGALAMRWEVPCWGLVIKEGFAPNFFCHIILAHALCSA